MTEDLSVFFADLGVTAVYGTQTAKVLMDEPDEDVLSGRMISTGYAITYAATDLAGLKHNDAIIVDGTDYQVVSVRKQDDGKLIRATLQK
ncbi:MAG TPA: hypothetical protein VL968_05690 [Rhodocyclaceae bacterium]|nr:hypothetical protein [Rhodocyclaceae bacterium]